MQVTPERLPGGRRVASGLPRRARRLCRHARMQYQRHSGTRLHIHDRHGLTTPRGGTCRRSATSNAATPRTPRPGVCLVPRGQRRHCCGRRGRTVAHVVVRAQQHGASRRAPPAKIKRRHCNSSTGWCWAGPVANSYSTAWAWHAHSCAQGLAAGRRHGMAPATVLRTKTAGASSSGTRFSTPTAEFRQTGESVRVPRPSKTGDRSRTGTMEQSMTEAPTSPHPQPQTVTSMSSALEVC